MPLFRDIPADELARIAEITREVRYAPGQAICRRGERGEDLYMIVAGAVTVRHGDHVLAELGPGEVVGELAVLDSNPRSADVIALSPLRVLTLGGGEFRALIERHAVLAGELLRVLAARVRNTSARQERVDQLIRAFRERGHVLAALDPLEFSRPGEHPELTLGHYSLDDGDLGASFSVTIGREAVTLRLRQLLDRLRAIYCGAIGFQYMHIDDLGIQSWLRERIEDPSHHAALDREEQLRILAKLTDAEVFEAFVQRKFGKAKRFSLEGAETLIPLLDQAIETAGAYGVEEVVIGMAHRGRLNVLANIMGKPASQIFREFGDAEQDRWSGQGDVKYHLGHAGDRTTTTGRSVRLSLCFNPSHLEFVGPVVLGRARAKQDRAGDGPGARVLPLVVHGDAAFAGQGVVQELFNLSGLAGYATGGAIHVVLNNQIGFTTPPSEYRSTQYATDIARMLQIPIFHVNGERPEAVDRVIKLAMEFRDSFEMDVVIDMYCYRRHGHNEGDDPTFTQPLLYDAIRDRRPMRVTYAENLSALGAVGEEEAAGIAKRSYEKLDSELARTKAAEAPPAPASQASPWEPYRGGAEGTVADVATGVPEARIVELLVRLASVPEAFTPHARVARLLAARRAMAEGKRPVDWGAAEALAFATLLLDGHPIRLSGQDSQRGTFGHRHAVIHDRDDGAPHVPLRHLSADQARFDVYNSPLSEAGVLGFDFGYSLDRPEGLVIWEAQFGDFCNVAQVIVDQFIAAAEDKWNQLSGLCLLLPHGFEGQGPEHSSARIERFLSLAANDNMQIVCPSTAAQYFHCLRRQVLRPWRKPLIVMSPKGLLQLPTSGSAIDALAGGAFERVIGDETVSDRAGIERVVMCTGKLYHQLARSRARHQVANTAIVRLEQLYPFPGAAISGLLASYPGGAEVVWAQEEPENMGAWPFLRHRLGGLVEERRKRPLRCISRPESTSPAVGSKAVHDAEQERLIDAILMPGA